MEAFHGGCFCGSVRFEAAEIFDAGYCHCSICRRFSGSPLCVWANTPARTAHIWCESRLSYFDTADDLPRFDRGELSHPSRRGSWRAR